MPLPPAALAVLASGSKEKSLEQVLSENPSPYNRIYAGVRRLSRLGLIRTRREGKAALIQTVSPRLAEAANIALFQSPRRDLDKILYGDRPTLLHVLDHVGSPALAALVLQRSRAAIHKAVKQFLPAGLLARDGKGYRIHKSNFAIRNLLEEWNRAAALHRARQADAQSTLEWFLGPEAVFWTPRPPTILAGLRPASVTALQEWGILVMSPTPHWFQGRRTPGAADAALQCLLGDVDATRRAYACLLVERTGADLRPLSPIYGLQNEAVALHAYLRDHAADGFLKWKDYDAMRKQYGVAK